MSKDCWEWKNGHHKKFEKAEKAVDGDGEDLVLCPLMSESKKEIEKKKVRFTENGKQPLEAGMMCTIDGDTFFCSWRIPGPETQEHHVISSTMPLAYMTSPTSICPSKATPVLCLLQKRKTLSQGAASWWDWTGHTYSIASEVLPQGRCEPVFPNVWTLAGKQDFKRPLK